MNSSIAITTTVIYRPERIPPRCRKPRPVFEQFVITTEVPSVSGGNAPVAAVLDSESLYSAAIDRPAAGLRYYGGNLYTRDGDNSANSTGFTIRTAECWTSDRAEAEERAVGHLKDLLIVDGMVWRRIGEPFYVVRVYGMSANHGGTTIGLDFLRDGTPLGAREFAVTEPEAAIEAALKVASKRRDTHYLEAIREFRGIKVLIPEAFKIAPQSARAASKEAEARALANEAASLLSESFDREQLRKIQDLLKDLDVLVWDSGVETVNR